MNVLPCELRDGSARDLRRPSRSVDRDAGLPGRLPAPFEIGVRPEFVRFDQPAFAGRGGQGLR